MNLAVNSSEMSIQVQMEQMSGYLAARLIGSSALEEALRQVESIAEHCKLTNNNKLLIDLVGVNVTTPSLVDSFRAAERMRIFARYGIKAAFIDIPERIDSRKFGVLVAQNRGVNIEVFTDLQAAEEWLSP